MNDFHVKEAACPHCQQPLDMASMLQDIHDGSPPEPGDATVCMHCAALLKFTEDMSLAEFTADELEALPADALMELLKVRAIVVRIKEEYPSA